MLNISNTLKTRTKKELKMTNKLTAIWGSLAPASAELFFFARQQSIKRLLSFAFWGYVSASYLTTQINFSP